MTLPVPPTFADDDEYERSLGDSAFWAPYARAALRLAGLEDTDDVRTHVPTTHVAALVGDRYLVKLHYEDWFGEDCFQTEREAYRCWPTRRPVPGPGRGRAVRRGVALAVPRDDGDGRPFAPGAPGRGDAGGPGPRGGLARLGRQGPPRRPDPRRRADQPRGVLRPDPDPHAAGPPRPRAVGLAASTPRAARPRLPVGGADPDRPGALDAGVPPRRPARRQRLRRRGARNDRGSRARRLQRRVRGRPALRPRRDPHEGVRRRQTLRLSTRTGGAKSAGDGRGG
jgi:hypothetical protein